MLAAIQRSAQPSPDTPIGFLNEMFNPIRQGAQAREFAGKAAGAMRRGEMGRAAGMGALMAMAVPGVPGRKLTAVQKAVMKELEAGGYVRQFGNGATVHSFNGKVMRRLGWDVWGRMQDAVPDLRVAKGAAYMGEGREAPLYGLDKKSR